MRTRDIFVSAVMRVRSRCDSSSVDTRCTRTASGARPPSVASVASSMPRASA